MEFGKPVWYVGQGGARDLAFLTATYDGKGDLVVVTGNGNSEHKGVAHRAPADYDENGGGHTWHLQSEAAGD